jgi:hypothetical protein
LGQAGESAERQMNREIISALADEQERLDWLHYEVSRASRRP